MVISSKILFGGHFYPYHITLWFTVSTYNLVIFIQNKYFVYNLIVGFLFSSILWTFTEYMFHRYLLHILLYKHHIKHHNYPNKLSLIHTPMCVVILNWTVYYYLFNPFLNSQIITSYSIFFPLNYISFELVHLWSHTYRGDNKIIINAKIYHKYHHINEKMHFSFVTSFWDYVFGTLSDKYVITNKELLLGFLPFYAFSVH